MKNYLQLILNKVLKTDQENQPIEMPKLVDESSFNMKKKPPKKISIPSIQEGFYWFGQYQIAPIGKTVYYLDMNNLLQFGEVIGYVFTINSNFDEKASPFEVNYKIVERGECIGMINEISHKKAFVSKELLIRKVESIISGN